jgi:hypothetical protein
MSRRLSLLAAKHTRWIIQGADWDCHTRLIQRLLITPYSLCLDNILALWVLV